jgi:hypothetical protein
MKSGIEEALDECAVNSICSWWRARRSYSDITYLAGFLHGIYMSGAFSTLEHPDATSDLGLLSDIVHSEWRL